MQTLPQKNLRPETTEPLGENIHDNEFGNGS
jgi:hypothetical protein